MDAIGVVCCFTALAFVDVQQLSREHLIKDNNGALWIRKARQKTNQMCNIPVLSIPQRILRKYEDNVECIKKGVLLPVISNQRMNAYLKEIADVCGIAKRLTTHVARHTFASVVCISQGVPIETVSKIMGHRNISTTQRYAKITQEKIDRDVTALSFNIEDKFTLQGIDSEPSHILKDVSRRKYRPSKRPMTKSEKRTIITDK